MTTMLLYQNENLLIDFHYDVYEWKDYSIEGVVWSFIDCKCWTTISIMVNGKLKRVAQQIDVSINKRQHWNLAGRFDIMIEDEDWNEYIASIKFSDFESILRAFSQIWYDIDTVLIYKQIKEYIEKVTTNYLNPQNQKILLD